MREIIVNELTRAFQQMGVDIAHYLPRLVVMLIFVLIGWMIAYL